ncbi:MAG: hypothetical protein AAFO69_10595 [Bacteroidota bacterium]
MKKEDRIDQVLSSLDGIQKAKAPKGSFEGIKERLATEHIADPGISNNRSNGWMKIAAVITLAICANIWAVSNINSTEDVSQLSSDGYPQLINDFNLYENE